MNILVTGFEGYIGNATVGQLKKEGNFVVGIEKEKNPQKEVYFQPDVSLRGDIRDMFFLKRVIAEYEIQEIYHFASWPITRVCSNDPYSTYDINIMGSVALFEACRSLNHVKNIVISTSDKAFGKAPVPYTEKTPLEPLFTYDTSKACQQLIALSYANNYNLPIKIVACSNVYGPRDYNMSRVIPNTITRLAKGQNAMLWKDSEEHIREFVYIDDVANAFITVAKNGKNGEVYCCGGTEHLNMKQLISKICQIMGKDPQTHIDSPERPTNLMEIKEQYQSGDKLKSIGWNPKFSLDEGIARSIDYYVGLSQKTPSTSFKELHKVL